MPFRKAMNTLKIKTHGGFANEGIGNEGCDSYSRQNHGHSIENKYTSCLEDANKLNRQVAEIDQRIKTEISRLAKLKSDTGTILCLHEDQLLVAADILADTREILTSECHVEGRYNSKMAMDAMVMNIITPDLRRVFGHDETPYLPETTIRHQISKFEYKLERIRRTVRDERKDHIEICHSYEVMQASCLRNMGVISDIRRIITELTVMFGESIGQSGDASNLRDDGSAIHLSEDKIMDIERDLRLCQSEVDSILQELSIDNLAVRDADLNKPILSNLQREKVEEYLTSSRNASIPPPDAAMDEAEEYITTLANAQSERHAMSEVSDLITF